MISDKAQCIQIKKEYGIYFKIPDGKVKDCALSIAKKHGSNITPHITVLQAVFLEDSLKEVHKNLRSWANAQKPLKIIFKKKLEKGGGGNTFWNVQTESPLHDANSALTEVIDPLRDGILDQVKKNMPYFSNTELKNIEKYGRHFNVPGANQPHITVAYGVQNFQLINEISTQIENIDTTQILDEISLGEIDSQGNIIETLQTYKLGG
ncbi:hypothetical protein GW846_06310 [Candidatus Gracilibacteria bacterium]|nr:hypothetical protein [Candidatus Gracilibacteria bacterium]